ILALDPTNPLELRIDVIELMNDGIEFGDPRLGARVEALLPRSVERLITEARQRERDEVLHMSAADSDHRRLGDEPLRASGDAASRPVAPEVIARFACR